jgi:hypothetical protein
MRWPTESHGKLRRSIAECVLEMCLRQAHCLMQLGSFEMHPGEAGSFEMPEGKAGSFKMRPVEPGSFEMRVEEHGSFEMGA